MRLIASVRVAGAPERDVLNTKAHARYPIPSSFETTEEAFVGTFNEYDVYVWDLVRRNNVSLVGVPLTGTRDFLWFVPGDPTSGSSEFIGREFGLTFDELRALKAKVDLEVKTKV